MYATPTCFCKWMYIKIQSVVRTYTVCCMTRAGFWLERLVNVKYKDTHTHKLLLFPYESDFLSSPRGIKELKNHPGAHLHLGKRFPHPTVLMPWQANLSREPKRLDLKTSSMVINNQVPGARLCYPLKKRWPWACSLPSLSLSFLICHLGNNNSAYFIKWLWGLNRLLLIKQ